MAWKHRMVVALALSAVASVVVGAEPIGITEGNVDPNTGNLLWSFENGKSYVLANDITGGLVIKDVNDVTIDLSWFKVQGDGSKGKFNLDCGAIDGESECAANGCPVFHQCTGGSSNISCDGTSQYYCNPTDSPGCTWNSSTSQCEGSITCKDIADYECSIDGCSTGDYWGCYGIISVYRGLAVSNSHNIRITGGRIQGFAVGINVTSSDAVKISGVTSIGVTQGISVASTSGNITLDDCIIGTTGGTTSATFIASAGGVIMIEGCIFTGGKVSSNSAAVKFVDCVFQPAIGSTYTEVAKGQETVKTTGLPDGFVMADFVAYLNKGGAMMFGTNWCSYCKKQRELFGDSFSGIVEYDCTLTGDVVTDQQKKDTMAQLGVNSFPTWLMPDGKLYPGFKTIPELANLSGYIK